MANPTYRLPAATVQEDFALVPPALQQQFYACVIGPNRAVAKAGLSASSDLYYGAYSPSAGNDVTLRGLPAGCGADPGSVVVTLTNVLAQVASTTFSSGPGTGFVVGAGSTLNQVSLEYPNAEFVSPDSTVHGFAASVVGGHTFTRLPILGNRDVKTGDTVLVTTSSGTTYSSVVQGLLPLKSTYSASSVDLAGLTGGNDSGNAPTVTSSAVFSVVRAAGTCATATQNTAMSPDYRNTGNVSDTFILEATSAGTVGTNALTFAYTSLNGDNGVSTSTTPGVLTVGSLGLKIALGAGTVQIGDQFKVVAVSAWTQVTLVPEVVTTNWTWTNTTSYRIQVIRGGLLGTDTCRVAISAVTGNDIGSQANVTGNTYFNVGSYGFRAKFASGTLRTGDSFIVNNYANTTGAMGTLVLRTPFPPSEANNQITALTVLSSNGDVTIPEYGYPTPGTIGWSLSPDGKTVEINNILGVLDPTYLDSYGNPLSATVYSAGIQVEWTSIIQTDANTIGSITSLASIQALLGPSIPENELSMAALSCFENSNGQPIYYLPTAGTSILDWGLALGALEATDTTYFLVPTTLDLSVLDLFQAHVLEMSSTNVGFERALIACREALYIVPVVSTTSSGTATNGYVTADGLGGFTLAVMTGQTLLESARAGDVVRTNYSVDIDGNPTYDSYVIGSVLSETTVSLLSGPSGIIGSITYPHRMEIWRNLTASEAAASFGDQSTHFQSRRVTNIWPDNAELSDGTSVPGWALGAAYAGLCSSVVPHQPLTNVQIIGFNRVPDVFRFNRVQLDTIAAGGTCIITQDTKNGPLYIRHQLTTDRTDVNTEEFSITRNADSISKFMRSFLRPFCGQYNINPDFLGMMETLTRQRFDYLEKTTANLKAGPQLLNYGPAVTVAQDPLIRTRVTIYVPVSLPYPANNLDMTIVIV